MDIFLKYIQEYMVSPEQLLSNADQIYAHTTENGNERETISEHTHKCIKFLELIEQQKNISTFFFEVEQQFLNNTSTQVKDFFYELLINTFTFHDFGKVNPLFQKEKMKNHLYDGSPGNLTIGSKHSSISAIIYLEYFLQKMTTIRMSAEEKRKVRIFMCINAYVISKHHSKLGNIHDFIHAFEQDGNNSYIFKVITEHYKQYFQDRGIFLQNQYTIKRIPSVSSFFPNKKEEAIMLYAYEKYMYSTLIACDYYATTQFQEEFLIESLGNISNINHICDIYEKTELVQHIRDYESHILNNKNKENRVANVNQINELRNEIFLETEETIKKNIEKNIFYLEAPTGSGKSNIALNLSLTLAKENKNINKIWYIYPFNTLVEQNVSVLQEIFSEQDSVLDQIHVINSITPIDEKMKNKKLHGKEKYEAEVEECTNDYYTKELLDRQFYHYPITISTHVTLFQILFGNTRDSGIGFYQLVNSVVILDEIQSYKNDIWTEIITFLKIFAKILHMKIIIMSATLPDLDILSKEQTDAIFLINNPQIYLQHQIFKLRNHIFYDFLDDEFRESNEEEKIYILKKSILEKYENNKKILVEFITKKRANDFYQNFVADHPEKNIFLLTGDDNSISRTMILKQVEEIKGACLLISTQVIEAGVDLKTIEVGYKNISVLDSEEQFMGRVNRNGKERGEVYFFMIDNVKDIYKHDIRSDQHLTIQDQEMRKILENKQFDKFYEKVFSKITEQNNSMNINKNIDEFFEQTGLLNIEIVNKRMKLIEDERQRITVFLAHSIFKSDEEIIDGKEVWTQYKMHLENRSMQYAKWKIQFSQIKSKMSYFVYEVDNVDGFTYDEKVGDIYYIKEGDLYLENGKLDRKRISNKSRVLLR